MIAPGLSIETYNTIIDWIVDIFFLDVALCLLLATPFALFRRTRGFAGIAIIAASWIGGAALWIGCATLTYALWGIAALVAGILILGVGVLPMALIAAGWISDWSDFWALSAMMAILLVLRLAGSFLMHKADTERADLLHAPPPVT
jgi:hypothetical protein